MSLVLLVLLGCCVVAYAFGYARGLHRGMVETVRQLGNSKIRIELPDPDGDSFGTTEAQLGGLLKGTVHYADFDLLEGTRGE